MSVHKDGPTVLRILMTSRSVWVSHIVCPFTLYNYCALNHVHISTSLFLTYILTVSFYFLLCFAWRVEAWPVSHVWRLENKSVLSFYCVGPRNGAQVISYQALPAHACCFLKDMVLLDSPNHTLKYSCLTLYVLGFRDVGPRLPFYTFSSSLYLCLCFFFTL